MHTDEYRQLTRKTANYPNAQSHTLGALNYTALGLGEAGEVQGKIKKLFRDDVLDYGDSVVQIPTDKLRDIVSEMGDVLWYLDRMADELGLPLDYIMKVNVDKLTDRASRGVIGGSGDHR